MLQSRTKTHKLITRRHHRLMHLDVWMEKTNPDLQVNHQFSTCIKTFCGTTDFQLWDAVELLLRWHKNISTYNMQTLYLGWRRFDCLSWVLQVAPAALIVSANNHLTTLWHLWSLKRSVLPFPESQEKLDLKGNSDYTKWSCLKPHTHTHSRVLHRV